MKSSPVGRWIIRILFIALVAFVSSSVAAECLPFGYRADAAYQRNGIIGAVVGAVLGTLVAFALDPLQTKGHER